MNGIHIESRINVPVNPHRIPSKRPRVMTIVLGHTNITQISLPFERARKLCITQWESFILIAQRGLGAEGIISHHLPFVLSKMIFCVSISPSLHPSISFSTDHEWCLLPIKEKFGCYICFINCN